MKVGELGAADSASAEPPQALAGIKVLELANLYAGPLLGSILGDFGAEVVKVEHPRGDDARRWGQSKDGIPLWWKVIARNKRLVTLDLHQVGHRELVRRLATWADIVIESFRPGRMEEWGLGYDELSALNPRLIMVRVTGFGQDGPYSDRPGFGTLAEAFSGFASMTGAPDGPPTLPPFGLADGVAALAGTFGVLAALYWRDKNPCGTGQWVDLSLYEPLFSILGPQVIEYTQLGTVQMRQGNTSPRTAPRNAYRTSDGQWVVLSAGTQQIADRIFEAIGRPELSQCPEFANGPSRATNSEAIDRIVGQWIAEHSLESVLRRFELCAAPIAPVYNVAQILVDEHYRTRRSVVEVTDEDLGVATMQNVVPRLSQTPGRIRHTGRTQMGHDAEYVFRELLRVSDEEIAQLLQGRGDDD